VGRSFLRYGWPHNVRELRQCLAGMVALSDDGLLGRRHLPEALARASSRPPVVDPGPSEPNAGEKLRMNLLALLAQHGGNVSEVARALGKARMQVHRWCKKFGIDPDRFRT